MQSSSQVIKGLEDEKLDVFLLPAVPKKADEEEDKDLDEVLVAGVPPKVLEDEAKDGVVDAALSVGRGRWDVEI